MDSKTITDDVLTELQQRAKTQFGDAARLADVQVAAPNAKRADVPDAWAPRNRAGQPRDQIDRYLNERVASPTSIAEAMVQLHLALEFYEHAQEIAVEDASVFYDVCREEGLVREAWMMALMTPIDQRSPTEAAALGEAFAKSRSAAADLVDTTRPMETFLKRKGELARAKAVAEKDLGIARRRHATAVVALQALTFAPTEQHTSGVVSFGIPKISGLTASAAAANDTVRVNVAEGDTDAATVAD
jgi:hypothetical protein